MTGVMDVAGDDSDAIASVVIASELGVLLDTYHNRPVWSGVPAQASSDAAPCFTREQAMALLRQLTIPADLSRTVQLHAVVPDLRSHDDGAPYASAEACARAGLPGWMGCWTAQTHEYLCGERPRIH